MARSVSEPVRTEIARTKVRFTELAPTSEW
jgi:hypothetical protein